MYITKIAIFGMLIVGIIFLITVFSIYSTQEKIIVFECSPKFWKNNLDLWKVVDVDYNSDFDKTFGKDYFEPDITLEDAIKKEGVGMNHLASSGTAAYLSSLLDPEIDEETVRTAVNFGYVHQIDNYLANCNEIERKVPNLMFG
ncbi:MAG: hypothetical protein OEM77_06275 [Nitrosopumilus sp.]|nr:hypothetical protein [Nitrosopumilus sp.]MDH3737171.1 hypothetical protein [Nitrosopumilus sp.]MDH3824159.1 hypothetical protein [Nitrosopumilus sp.]MDH3835103.1 hypothetical protein [Nitrosopumilus sp.]